MSTESNNTFTFIVGFAAFKLGEAFSSPPLPSAGQLKIVEPDFQLQQADVRANQSPMTVADERTLPGRCETYSKIGANVFKIHREGREQPTLTRLSSAQSEALRCHENGWLRYDGEAEINMPGTRLSLDNNIELTLACVETDDGD